MSLNAAATCYSRPQFGVYRFRGQFEMNTGTSHTLLKKKSALSFNVSDLPNTNKRHYTLHSYDVYANCHNSPETRVFKLSFSPGYH
ncbi:MAG: outer membrane beta-barrel protein [Chitinophagaceae bacterium]